MDLRPIVVDQTWKQHVRQGTYPKPVDNCVDNVAERSTDPRGYPHMSVYKSLSLRFDNRDADGELDFVMRLDGDGMRPDGTNRLVKLDHLSIELDPRLLLDGRRHIG